MCLCMCLCMCVLCAKSCIENENVRTVFRTVAFSLCCRLARLSYLIQISASLKKIPSSIYTSRVLFFFSWLQFSFDFYFFPFAFLSVVCVSPPGLFFFFFAFEFCNSGTQVLYFLVVSMLIYSVVRLVSTSLPIFHFKCAIWFFVRLMQHSKACQQRTELKVWIPNAFWGKAGAHVTVLGGTLVWGVLKDINFQCSQCKNPRMEWRWLRNRDLCQMNLPSCQIIMTNNQVNGISK